MTDREYLTEKVNSIKSVNLKKTCLLLLANEQFFISPAAAKYHQAYTGGLAEHTRQVMEIALSMASVECTKDIVSIDVIIAGSLWHDYGKIWDYKKNNAYRILKESGALSHCPNIDVPEWVYDRHRWTVRHLCRSYAEFFAMAKSNDCGDIETEDVCHCILAHHGRHEHGSPVTPLTPEARMIHAADGISAFHIGKPHLVRGTRTDWQNL